MTDKIWNYGSNNNDAFAKDMEKVYNIVLTSAVMANDLVARVNSQAGGVVVEPRKGTRPFYKNCPTLTANQYCKTNEFIVNRIRARLSSFACTPAFVL